MSHKTLAVFTVLIVTFVQSLSAAEPTFLDFVRTRAASLRANDKPPATLADWRKQRARIRARLLQAWGGFPKEHAPLNPKILGTLERDGYRVERITFQTLPGVRMTANAYVPEKTGKLPAVLCVHGHWRGAKQDPVVQSRCIGLAKLGFFVLSVDAFGAGERGLGKALGEYHGEMVGATLWPIGRPLSGLQVYENGRAVDYMLTRPEVDGDRLGITGTSGGGNQTMYAGAWDERFKASVPTCSVGNYQAYLGVACCMCEVVPGALQFTEEWGVLALTAPRGLMVTNATKDGIQFSVGEAKKSLAGAQPVFDLYDVGNHLKHNVVEATHGYNQPMREAMYGWMTWHLKGEGDGSPIPEPEHKTEDPESIRCYPGTSRPGNWLTIPQFAAREARKLSEVIQLPATADAWLKQREQMRQKLDALLGRTSPRNRSDRPQPGEPGAKTINPEPGIQLPATLHAGDAPQRPGTVILLSFDDTDTTTNLLKRLREQHHQTLALTLRATKGLAHPRDAIRRAPDHNSAEWSLWLGRPLLGQWVMDVRSALNMIGAGTKSNPVTMVGVGPAGVVALAAAAIDDRVEQVVTVGSLASYISDVPYEGQRLGIMASGIVHDVGDIQHLAAMVAPRTVMISGGVDGGGDVLGAEDLMERFSFARRAFSLLDAGINLRIESSHDGVFGDSER